jgi:hypothetical protein
MERLAQREYKETKDQLELQALQVLLEPQGLLDRAVLLEQRALRELMARLELRVFKAQQV